jgi:SHS2 domain-containing protein
MAKKFEYLSHTADAKFRAYGKTLEEKFVNAAYAAFGIMYDSSKVNPLIKKEIILRAKKTESLLYDWIDELLFYLDSEGWFLAKVEKIEIKGGKLKATVYGDDCKKYSTEGHVKGVTYSEMEINDEYVQVVLDM